tara:strand:- start:4210 stop:5385 length:1176 start_codon:yes stop_codon:yes gene_type:complete
MIEEEYKYKRELGDGKWDKILKRKLTELSVSDDYNEAKHEWIATGNCWWSGLSEMPEWVTTHPRKCLCSHNIVYHFEILNTENGIRECVGSDHINSYLILRAINEETGTNIDAITEQMIEEWINVRVEGMKKTAWWHTHGESFKMMFDTVKDLDLRVNVRKIGKYYSSEYKQYLDNTQIRKSSKGIYGSPQYKMASIVWRWNHPNNPKRQSETRGYPTEKLMNDVTLFYAMFEMHKALTDAEDKKLAERLKEVENERDEFKLRQERIREIERNKMIASNIEENQEDGDFEERCAYFGIRTFSEQDAVNSWERKFLSDIRDWLLSGKTPTEAQKNSLLKILNREKGEIQMATEKQCNYLRNLGYEGDYLKLSKSDASAEISKLLEERRKGYE